MHFLITVKKKNASKNVLPANISCRTAVYDNTMRASVTPHVS